MPNSTVKNIFKLHIFSKFNIQFTYILSFRYKLNMLISDDSGLADLIAFEKEAEHLIKHTVKELTDLESKVKSHISLFRYKKYFLNPI